MEFLFEILFEVYAELMFLIVPEKKGSQKYKRIAAIIAAMVLLGVMALVIWGAVLISDRNNLMGILPISIAVLISLAQIIAGIVLFRKNHS